MMDLGHLKAFLAVIKYGSVGRAAESLNMTQSTLTRILQRLEQQVGVRLFERTTTGMILTNYGNSLQPYAHLLLAESENAERELKVLRGLETGTVKVGSVSSGVETIVPVAVERLLGRHPDLKVRILEGLDAELQEWLIKGDIDLAVSFNMPESEDIQVVCKSPLQDGCQVVAATTHPLRGKQGLEMADLVEQRWALTPRPMGPHREWRQMFLDHGLAPPHVAVETDSLGAMRALVAHSGFLSWLPRTLYSFQGSPGLIDTLPVMGVSTFRFFSVSRRRSGLLSAPTAALMEELRRVLAGMPDCRKGETPPGR